MKQTYVAHVLEAVLSELYYLLVLRYDLVCWLSFSSQTVYIPGGG